MPSPGGARAAQIGGGAWIGALRRASTVLLIVCAVLWLLALLMQAGVVRRQDTWAGPFVTEAPESPLVVLKMGRSRPLRGLTDTGGDDLDNPSRSNIVVTVAGERWEVGHAPHAELRAGRTRAFSHWGDNLYLVLPAGLANGPQLVITADYTLQPRPSVTRTLLFAVALLGALRFRIAFVEGGWQGFVRRLTAIRRAAGIAGVVLAALALTVYAIVIIYGWIAGYALPTVALFDVFPAMRRLALWEPNAPNALYALAGVGAIVEWLIRLGEGRSKTERSESSGTMRGARLALLFGGVFLTLLFVMSNGGWRGVMSPADMNYMSIAGLLPHSDAANYFFAATDLSVDGRWNPVASQRPIAAAIRTGIVAVGGTYVASLVLQAALLAICASIAILGVAEILGVWSAMAFAGLLLGLERPYVTTTMTETLGLGVAVLSAPFLLRGLRDQSYGSALGGLRARDRRPADPDGQHVHAALSCGLGHCPGRPQRGRPGGARGRRARRRGIVVCPVDPLAAIRRRPTRDWRRFLLHSLRAGDRNGLVPLPSRKWCEAASLPRSITSIAFERAWQAFLVDPTVMAGSLVRNATNYIVDLPILLFRQYANVASIPSEWIALGVAAPILVVAARIKAPFYAWAMGFFVLLYLTTVASAAFLYGADGRRVMIVSNVLLSLALALGFALPGAPRPAASRGAEPTRSVPDPFRPSARVWPAGVGQGQGALQDGFAGLRIGDTMRIAAAPGTPAVLVQPSEISARPPPDGRLIRASSTDRP